MTRPGQVRSAFNVRQVLRALARKDTYAAPDAAGRASGYAVYSAYDARRERPLLIVPAELLADGRGRGWFERDAEGCLRLAAIGRRALRNLGSRDAGAAQASAKSRKAAPVQRMPYETPLVWLRSRRDKDGIPLITQTQYEAGERLADDHNRAQIVRAVTSDWSALATASRQSRRAAPDSRPDTSDSAAAARRRVHRALNAVGTELAGILIDVCCFETRLETAERAEGWPQRAGKVVLQLALTALARHYGMIAPDAPIAARLRHWGDAGYKPTIEAWNGKGPDQATPDRGP